MVSKTVKYKYSKKSNPKSFLTGSKRITFQGSGTESEAIAYLKKSITNCDTIIIIEIK